MNREVRCYRSDVSSITLLGTAQPAYVFKLNGVSSKECRSFSHRSAHVRVLCGMVPHNTLQADGMVKNRPAILMREMPPFRDVLVCGVSTQLRQAAKDFDEVISPTDADFTASGLKKESLMRLGFLAVIPRNKIAGSIGSISSERHESLSQRLSEHLVR